jgi:hypothetical protein
MGGTPPLLSEHTLEALLRRGPWRAGWVLIALIGCGPRSVPATTASSTNEPRSSTAVAPTVATRAPAEGAGPACNVRVDAVLSSEVFRGYRSTPATRAAVDALSPEHYEQWVAESHGASYLLCTYRVIVEGGAYRFVEAHDTTFEPRDPAACETARADVEEHIRAVTEGCTDLHRGAYYGADLEPVD